MKSLSALKIKKKIILIKKSLAFLVQIWLSLHLTNPHKVSNELQNVALFQVILSNTLQDIVLRSEVMLTN